MLSFFKRTLAAVVLAIVGYLLLWPVTVDPVAWDAPRDAGYIGAYAPNQALADLERHDILGRHGPEDATIGSDGALYISTGEGDILRRTANGETQVFVDSLGRPLGIGAAPDGTLWVADAFHGLMRIRDGVAELVLTQTDDGVPILYANSLDIAPDGMIYLSDSSTRFGALAVGSTLDASYLEILEHRSSGRIIRFDPATGEAVTVLDGISFANGLAVGGDGAWLLFVETGTYALRKLWIAAPREGDVEDVLTNLPGFPDNLKRDAAGGFLLGLVSKRAPLADMAAPYPFLRKMLQRLPAAWRPKAVSHGFILRLDEDGAVTQTWQDPAAGYPLTTGAVRDADGALWITSLSADWIGRLP